MNPDNKTDKEFVGYEYIEITVSTSSASMYIDCYENFGWEVDENTSCFSGRDRDKHGEISGGIRDASFGHQNQTVVRLKRNRKIMAKTELTRLQRHFEACINELKALERAKTQAAAVWALIVGIVGTVFMAGSVFAVSGDPPVIWLCALLAVPGFAGWILPYFLYGYISRKKTQKIQPLMEEKLDEIYKICEKGHSLL